MATKIIHLPMMHEAPIALERFPFHLGYGLRSWSEIHPSSLDRPCVLFVYRSSSHLMCAFEISTVALFAVQRVLVGMLDWEL